MATSFQLFALILCLLPLCFGLPDRLLVRQSQSSAALAKEILTHDAEWICFILYGVPSSPASSTRTITGLASTKTIFSVASRTTRPLTTTTFAVPQTITATHNPSVTYVRKGPPSIMLIISYPGTVSSTTTITQAERTGAGVAPVRKRGVTLPFWLRPYSPGQIKAACQTLRRRGTTTTITITPSTTITSATTVTTTIPSIITAKTTPTVTTTLPVATQPGPTATAYAGDRRSRHPAAGITTFVFGQITFEQSSRGLDECQDACYNSLSCAGWEHEQPDGVTSL